MYCIINRETCHLREYFMEKKMKEKDIQKSETCHPCKAAGKASHAVPVFQRGKITIKDIAFQVGCAHSIVSNVLNNSGRHNRVSEEKRQLILETAHKLGYRSNLNAKRLVGKSTRMIGVIVSRNFSPISSDFIMWLTHLLSKRGYSTLLTSCPDASEEFKAINNFVDLGFDGIVTTFLENEIYTRDIPIPTVFVGNYRGQSDICTDFQYGESLAVRHLIRHGHRKVCFYCDRVSGNPEKYQGYLDALRETGIVPDPIWVLQTHANDHFEEQLFRLIRKERVRAFAGTSDEASARLMRYLQQHGLRIPEDIAITGCDANFSVLLTTPALTSIVYPTRDIASQTVELLLRHLEHRGTEEPSKRISIKPKLFIGGSCGCEPFQMEDVGYHYPSSRTIDCYLGDSNDSFCNHFCFEE